MNAIVRDMMLEFGDGQITKSELDEFGDAIFSPREEFTLLANWSSEVMESMKRTSRIPRNAWKLFRNLAISLSMEELKALFIPLFIKDHSDDSDLNKATKGILWYCSLHKALLEVYTVLLETSTPESIDALFKELDNPKLIAWIVDNHPVYVICADKKRFRPTDLVSQGRYYSILFKQALYTQRVQKPQDELMAINIFDGEQKALRQLNMGVLTLLVACYAEELQPVEFEEVLNKNIGIFDIEAFRAYLITYQEYYDLRVPIHVVEREVSEIIDDVRRLPLSELSERYPNGRSFRGDAK